jgi:tetratricopeptide (TPR) repeat protein
MRFIGNDLLYAQGEALRAQGKMAEALQTHEQFLARYPMSLAGHFVVGLEAYSLKNWERSRRAFALLEEHFPSHAGIKYNLALAQSELGQYPEAIRRYKWILARDPANYGTFYNLYQAQRRAGETSAAQATAAQMKRAFPNNADVDRMIAGN